MPKARKHRSRHQRVSRHHQARLEAALREAQGYFLVVDHNKVVSCVRWFDESERQEIVMLSEQAQADCIAGKCPSERPGICCQLEAATILDWVRYH